MVEMGKECGSLLDFDIHPVYPEQNGARANQITERPLVSQSRYLKSVDHKRNETSNKFQRNFLLFNFANHLHP